jgi:hypothetical protein
MARQRTIIFAFAATAIFFGFQGSDLGISTSIGGKTYFFMGDTAAKYSPRSDEQENEYLRNIYPPLDLYPHPTPMVPPGSHNGFSESAGDRETYGPREPLKSLGPPDRGSGAQCSTP